MESVGTISPSTLSLKDLPWQIMWSKDKCTLCGQCTAVCPVRAIELGVHRKSVLQVPVGLEQKASNLLSVYFGIDQRTDAAHACVGCGMCTMVCPNGAIMPIRSDEVDKLRFHVNQGGEPRRRG
ncbi:MAG: 4Fe-4S binding protein, partial [Syntrophaceae bacterium]|nr:4Fe-4S binding protein [Syntrophaceae bacterium]